MKNKKLKKPGSKKKFIPIVIILIIIFGGLAYFKFVHKDELSVSQAEQNAAEQADVDAAKERVDEEASEDEPLKDETGQPTTPVGATIGLSNLAFSQSDGQVNASVSVSGVSSGGCSFIFTDGDGRAITKIAQLSGGSCSVATSEAEFSMIGEYNLTAKVGDKSISKTITIN